MSYRWSRIIQRRPVARGRRSACRARRCWPSPFLNLQLRLPRRGPAAAVHRRRRALSFLLLMVVFRSILVPLKAAVMNLLSIGAAYGVIVAVFQWGWG
jgi:hypothetical protein